MGIPKPPWSGLGRRLISKCRKALYEFELIESRDVAVALSGGKDSLTLLYLLSEISGRGADDLNLTAIHVDGAYSCGPGVHRDYLEGICEDLSIPLIIKESEQKLETLSCYPCARERRKLLFDAAKQAGCQQIAFGHHRDDSIETLLMNLLHKAEFAANLPKVYMENYGVTIIRPLIYISEREILDFAKSQGYARITCQCPVGAKSHRMKTKQMIQTLETHFPNARENLAQAAHSYGSQKAATK